MGTWRAPRALCRGSVCLSARSPAWPPKERPGVVRVLGEASQLLAPLPDADVEALPVGRLWEPGGFAGQVVDDGRDPRLRAAGGLWAALLRHAEEQAAEACGRASSGGPVGCVP